MNERLDRKGPGSRSASPGRSDEDWLRENGLLRMDATRDVFPASRRAYHLERYRFAAQHARGAAVLDAACGTGYGAAILGEEASSVEGVDLSREAVEYARREYGSESVRFRQAPAELMPFPDDSFDLVVSFETLEHSLCPRSVLREFARVLKPNGAVLLSVPNKWGLTYDHFFDFDEPRLRELLGERFRCIDLFYHNSGDWKDRLPKGIGPLDSIRADRAECFLALCTQAIAAGGADRLAPALEEIYATAHDGHLDRLRARGRLELLSRIRKRLSRMRGRLGTFDS